MTKVCTDDLGLSTFSLLKVHRFYLFVFIFKQVLLSMCKFYIFKFSMHMLDVSSKLHLDSCMNYSHKRAEGI